MHVRTYYVCVQQCLGQSISKLNINNKLDLILNLWCLSFQYCAYRCGSPLKGCAEASCDTMTDRH